MTPEILHTLLENVEGNGAYQQTSIFLYSTRFQIIENTKIWLLEYFIGTDMHVC